MAEPKGETMKILAALICLLPTTAFAQQSYVNSLGNGHYIVQRPGGPTTYVNPTGNGSFVATTPGYGSTYGQPTGNGSYIITERPRLRDKWGNE